MSDVDNSDANKTPNENQDKSNEKAQEKNSTTSKNKNEIIDFTADLIRDYPELSPINTEDPININVAACMRLIKTMQTALIEINQEQQQARNSEIEQFAKKIAVLKNDLEKLLNESMVAFTERLNSRIEITTYDKLVQFNDSAQKIVSEALDNSKENIVKQANQKAQKELDSIHLKVEQLISSTNANTKSLLEQVQRSAKNSYIAAIMNLVSSSAVLAIILVLVWLAFRR